MNEQIWALWTGLGLITLALLMGVLSWQYQRRSWNGGRCRRCRHAWVYFETDNSRGFGFKCQCKRVCWVSFRSVMQQPEDFGGQ